MVCGMPLEHSNPKKQSETIKTLQTTHEKQVPRHFRPCWTRVIWGAARDHQGLFGGTWEFQRPFGREDPRGSCNEIAISSTIPTSFFLTPALGGHACNLQFGGTFLAFPWIFLNIRRCSFSSSVKQGLPRPLAGFVCCGTKVATSPTAISTAGTNICLAKFSSARFFSFSSFSKLKSL